MTIVSVLDSLFMGPESVVYREVKDHYLFAGLEDAVFEQLSTTMRTIQLRKNDMLFHRGDVARHFYFVHSGHIELTLTARAGEKKVVEVIGPGRTFAEAVAFMRGNKYPVSAEAISDCSVCQIPNTAYHDVLHSNVDACMRLLADVSRHLHARVRDIENLTIENARGRLVSYLLDRVAETEEDQATVRLELPKHVIASRLSVKPETLSRLLRNLADEGLISIEDRVVFIPSLSALRPYD